MSDIQRARLLTQGRPTRRRPRPCGSCRSMLFQHLVAEPMMPWHWSRILRHCANRAGEAHPDPNPGPACSYKRLIKQRGSQAAPLNCCTISATPCQLRLWPCAIRCSDATSRSDLRRMPRTEARGQHPDDTPDLHCQRLSPRAEFETLLTKGCCRSGGQRIQEPADGRGRARGFVHFTPHERDALYVLFPPKAAPRAPRY